MIKPVKFDRRWLGLSSVVWYVVLVAWMMLIVGMPVHADLADTIQRIKPAIVGIGTYQKTRSPPLSFLGTGFVVDDGLHVITNAHVVPELLSDAHKESLVIMTGSGDKPELRAAKMVALEKEYDIALLQIEGAPLPTMRLGDSATVREGQMLAFTGFPIGMVLGFYPVTHRASVASITPIILPAFNARQLDANKIRQLQRSAYKVFQLDGTAYPGNSGSPLYDQETGMVYGVINMVFVKDKKESVLSNPSGISYAIPGIHIMDLLRKYKRN